MTTIARHEDGLSISITNRGEDIPAEHLPRLFDRFYRSDQAREGGDNHHGLGLAIVAAIARMHGGHVFARSGEGMTTIGLRLPASGDASPGDRAT